MREHDNLLVLALLAFPVGGISGLIGSLFRLVLEWSDRFRGKVIDWAHGKEIGGFALVIGISAIATGLAAWLVRKFAPGAKGSGIPDIEMVLRDELPPPSPLILIPVKFFGGVLAMGTGLALGREGPTVQMGAAMGHFLAAAFRRNQDDVKALLAAGAGAGLATAFSAPVAGAVFVLEELVQRFDTRITVTTLCASGSAIALARLLLGNGPDFVLKRETPSKVSDRQSPNFVQRDTRKTAFPEMRREASNSMASGSSPQSPRHTIAVSSAPAATSFAR